MSRLLGFSGLKKLAQKIEPKKWNLTFQPSEGIFEIYTSKEPGQKSVVVSWMGFCGLDHSSDVAQFIASADPQTVIKMAERIEIQAAEIVRLRSQIRSMESAAGKK